MPAEEVAGELGRSVGRRADQVADVLEGAERALGAARSSVEAQVQASPYAALAVALGVGYVLGGGLFTRFTARTLSAGVALAMRIAIVPLVEQELGAVARGALGLQAPPAP